MNLTIPKSIKDIKSFLVKQNEIISKSEKRLENLKSQRPSIAYNGDLVNLKRLEDEIEKEEKVIENANLILQGAKSKIKTETENWIEEEEKKLEAKVADSKKEIQDIENEIETHKKAIEEAVGQKNATIIYSGTTTPLHGKKFSAEIDKRHVNEVRGEIKKIVKDFFE